MQIVTRSTDRKYAVDRQKFTVINEEKGTVTEDPLMEKRGEGDRERTLRETGMALFPRH